MRGLCDADMDTMISTREMTTRQPSMMFQPLDRYVRRPHTKPSAHTCRIALQPPSECPSHSAKYDNSFARSDIKNTYVTRRVFAL